MRLTNERSKRTPASGKRSDIQGLRAVAVVAVLLNHTFALPSGGFVGVDVFFVVSGFLITTHLLAEVRASGRVDLVAFAGRRLRRLAPVALTVLATTMAVVVAVLPPGRVPSIWTDALWSLFGAANFRFITVGTDYFQADGPTSPFQHFWSLAVEEQFYVALPALMLLLAVITRARRRPRMFRAVFGVLVTAVIALSFATATAQTAEEPTVAYFSVATRAWELGAGSALALLLSRARPLPELLGQVLAHLGLLVVIGSVFLVDETEGFPAPWALAPVAGTVLVILGGTTASRRHSFLLSNRVSSYVGDISYSLYLWHFPVIVVIEAVEPSAVLLAVPFSFGLAVASFHLIERPLLGAPWSEGLRGVAGGAWRRWARDQRGQLGLGGLVALSTTSALLVSLAFQTAHAATTVAAGPDVVTADSSDDTDPSAVDDRGPELTALQEQVRIAVGATSWPELSPPIEEYIDGEFPAGPDSRCKQYAQAMPSEVCVYGPADAPNTAVLIGDSTAAYELEALTPLFDAAGSTWKLEVRSALACVFLDYEVSDACTDYREETLRAVERDRPDLAIITNTYGPLQGDDDRPLSAAQVTERLQPYVERVSAAAGKVVMLAPPPRSTTGGVADCYRPQEGPSSCLSQVDRSWRQRAQVDQRIAEEVDGTWIDTSAVVCFAGRCPAFVDDHLVLNDETHYTAAFAERLAPVYEELLRGAAAFGPVTDGSQSDGSAEAAGPPAAG